MQNFCALKATGKMLHIGSVTYQWMKFLINLMFHKMHFWSTSMTLSKYLALMHPICHDWISILGIQEVPSNQCQDILNLERLFSDMSERYLPLSLTSIGISNLGVHFPLGTLLYLAFMACLFATPREVKDVIALFSFCAVGITSWCIDAVPPLPKPSAQSPVYPTHWILGGKRSPCGGLAWSCCSFFFWDFQPWFPLCVRRWRDTVSARGNCSLSCWLLSWLK